MISKEKVGLLGKKLGMMQLPNQFGKLIPVTAIEVKKNWVSQVKTLEKDGYQATQLTFNECSKKKINKAQEKHLELSKLANHQYFREIRDMSGYSVGQALDLSIFKESDRVTISGLSKGKGFAGVIKRYNKARGPMAHGSGYHRGVGSLSSGRDNNRVLKNKKMPGRMGRDKVTLKKVLVAKIDQENSVIFLKGAVPGPRKSWISLTKKV